VLDCLWRVMIATIEDCVGAHKRSAIAHLAIKLLILFNFIVDSCQRHGPGFASGELLILLRQNK
jgi:hypothetical protein